VQPTGKRAALGDNDPSILMSVRLFEETPHSLLEAVGKGNV